MERYMYQDDSFERMLRQKTDEYRMYPSDKSWAAIQSRLQKPKNGFNWKAAAAFAVVIVLSITLSNDDTVQNKPALPSAISLSPVADIKAPQFINELVKEKAVAPQFSNRSRTVKQQIPVAAINKPAATVSINNDQPVNTAENTIIVNTSVADDQSIQPAAEPVVTEQTVETKSLSLIKHEHTPTLHQPAPVLIQAAQTSSLLQQPAVVTTTEQPAENKTDAELNYEVNVPVVTRKKEARQLQIYAAPSGSYRVLVADNKFRFGNILLDPENEVRHQMSIGWEAGAAILYPVTKKIKFRTGLQVNYTRYDVEAYKTLPAAYTTIRLSNARVVSRPAALGNDNGLQIKEVANETYQLSIPVGVELNVAGGKKVQWNIAGNVQPSYLLKASGYLITNDYKNYIKAPDLLTNLNLNTAIETFIRWDAGGFQLQAGPQFRYQLFSNIRGTYPLKEHLVDYGFKIGFIKTLR